MKIIEQFSKEQLEAVKDAFEAIAKNEFTSNFENDYFYDADRYDEPLTVESVFSDCQDEYNTPDNDEHMIEHMRLSLLEIATDEKLKKEIAELDVFDEQFLDLLEEVKAIIYAYDVNAESFKSTREFIAKKIAE